jgi:hypothetical protein
MLAKTRQPSAANASAVKAPKPVLAPVIRMDFLLAMGVYRTALANEKEVRTLR